MSHMSKNDEVTFVNNPEIAPGSTVFARDSSLVYRDEHAHEDLYGHPEANEMTGITPKEIEDVLRVSGQ